MANIYTDIAMFDAELYLAKNPDVAAAIEGTEITAQDHYFLHGATESLTNNDRAPNAWFNAAEYKAQNPDLADVDANLLLAHFALHGVNEGRAPNAATAGEDGKIKPELLNDYVNAEGNADVKAAIAEMTGEEVGAELTAEQATIAMQHFFNHGINDSREGGIADVISNDAGVDLGDIVKAVENYQGKLDAQNAANEAAVKAAEKAEKELELNPGTESDDYVKDVAGALKAKVSTLETNGLNGVRDTADGLLPSPLAINDENVQTVRDSFGIKQKVAQQKVDVLKAQNQAVVNLQEKIAAYNTAAAEIIEDAVDFQAEAAKLQIANSLESDVKLTGANSAAELAVTVNLGDAGVAVLSFEKGKLVVKSEEVVDAEAELAGAEGAEPVDAEAVTDAKNALAEAKADMAAVVEAFEKLKGVEAFKAQVNVLYSNIAKEAAAEKAINAATIKALQDAGYKVYEDGKEDPVSWSKVKIEDGNLVAAKEGDETVFTLKALDKDGEPVDGKEDIALNSELAVTGTIDSATGKVGAAEGETPVEGETTAEEDSDNSIAKLGGNLPEAIKTAANNSAEAVTGLETVKNDIKAFEKALEKYNAAKELQKDLDAAIKGAADAADAVEKAEDAFDGLDVNFVKAEEGTATGEVYYEGDEDYVADLFVYGASEVTVDNFDATDLFYFGAKAAALAVSEVDVAEKNFGGDVNVLEIFAVQEGTDTVLYVEKTAFAGNSNTTAEDSADFVKVTLAGVNAEDLQLADGFLTLA